MERLVSDRKDGRVDVKAEPLLKALNGHPDYYTTSSCAGRVQLISVAGPGDKRSSHRWGIWHDAPTIEQVEAALGEWQAEVTTGPGDEPPDDGLLYLQAQSPIFHVACEGLEAAGRLRALAVNHGWKYSSLRGFKGSEPIKDRKAAVAAKADCEDALPRRPLPDVKKVMVELLCSERLDCPLARGNELYIRGPALAFVVDVARQTLDRTQARLPRLLQALDELR